MSVIPTALPFTVMVAPMIGSPEASFTCPLIAFGDIDPLTSTTTSKLNMRSRVLPRRSSRFGNRRSRRMIVDRVPTRLCPTIPRRTRFQLTSERRECSSIQSAHAAGIVPLPFSASVCARSIIRLDKSFCKSLSPTDSSQVLCVSIDLPVSSASNTFDCPDCVVCDDCVCSWL
jgi:hypothetical protein